MMNSAVFGRRGCDCAAERDQLACMSSKYEQQAVGIFLRVRKVSMG